MNQSTAKLLRQYVIRRYKPDLTKPQARYLYRRAVKYIKAKWLSLDKKERTALRESITAQFGQEL